MLSAGSLDWRPPLARAAARLRHDLDGVAPERFATAVDRQLRRRMAAFLDGIERYRRHPYRRRLKDPPTLWRNGATRLLDYGHRAAGDAAAVPLLVVPSLVNRGYILDLKPGLSLMRWLARPRPGHARLRPFLVDWGRPGGAERRLTLSVYVAGRLEAALDAVREANAGRPVVVVGYCMGGLLALALALRRRADLAGLALLATPWDFHAEQPRQAQLLAAVVPTLEPLLAAFGELPVDLIQALFASLDPFLAVGKFAGFAALDPDSKRAEAFVAVEDWLNDGVPLAAGVARECLVDWYGTNATVRGDWCVAGMPVRPERLALPTLVVVPGRDRIVPPASAAALAEAIPGARRLTPPLGHIGMVVAGDARAKVWRPLADWIDGLAGDGR
jgi:polyhydroxyalkanoate synthase